MSAFVSLCVAVCLATTALCIAAGVLAAQALWVCLCRIGLQRRALRYPSFLFLIRTLPLTLPVVFVCFAVLPSFLVLEPRQTAEKPDWWLAALAAFSLLAIGFAMTKLARTLISTRRAEREWMQSARRIDSPASIPIYELKHPDYLVAVVGLFSPHVFLGRRILAALTPEELQAAVAHEVAHVRSFDNLKQALLSATGMRDFFSPIDRAFRSAVEISADERAMSSRVSPLDLGSAIVKVARLKAVAPQIAASHLVPDFESSALQLRVDHLQAALEGPSLSKGLRYGWLIASMLLMIYLIKLPLWLALAHQLTELLVR